MVIIDDKILVRLIAFCGAIAVLILLLIIFFKFYYRWHDRKIARSRNVFTKYLVAYLFGDKTQAESALAMIRKFAHTRRNRNLLINKLLVLNHNFSGAFSEKVSDLYHELELYKVSLAKLHRLSWHKKVRGMYELSTLEYDAAFDEIAQLINDRRGEVRRNARVSLVKIRKKEALMTLADFGGNMSVWTFVNIMEILKRHPVKLTEAELNKLKSAKNKYINTLASELEQTVYVQ